MATHFGIAGVSEALRTVLQDMCPRAEFPDAQFELYQTIDFQKPMSDGVSIYLWRIAVNTSLRNLPPRVDINGNRYRPSLPLDLFYAIGVWGRTSLQQQRLLGERQSFNATRENVSASERSFTRYVRQPLAAPIAAAPTSAWQR